jgi:hypothetical protein
MKKMLRGLSLFGVIFLFCSSCSFAKPYEVKLVSDKRPPGKIIGILSDEGKVHRELFYPILVNDQKVIIYKDPALKEPAKSIDLPGNILSCYLKNTFRTGFSDSNKEEYNNIFLAFLCQGKDLNTIFLYQFGFDKLKKGDTKETRLSIFPTKADNIITISRDNKDGKALFVCQSKDKKLVYTYDILGEVEHITTYDSPMIAIPWEISASIIRYDGRIVHFDNFFDKQIVSAFDVDLGSQGDLSKALLKDSNYFDGFYGHYFSLFDGKSIYLINTLEKRLIYAKEFDDVTFTSQLNNCLYFTNSSMYFIDSFTDIDTRTEFAANKMFYSNYTPLYFLRKYDDFVFYFCSYGSNNTLVYDMFLIRDNHNYVYHKHSYEPIPGKVQYVLYSEYKAYFYTEDSVWECDYINSEEGQYELIKMDLGPEYEQK